MNLGTGSARRAGARAGNHPAVRTGARLGFAANGLLHLIIAWLALQLAWGGGGGQEADQTGALETLASSGPGAFLIWVVVVGFGLLGLWYLLEALLGGETKERVVSAGKGVTFLALGVIALGVAQGSGSGGGGSGGALNRGGMPVLVLAGLVLLGVAIHHVKKGWKREFLEDLRAHPGKNVERLGRVGYVAKGAALGVLGVLILVSPFSAGQEEEPGLDLALRTILDMPGGKVLLTLVALGLAAYGVYCFARAKLARV